MASVWEILGTQQAACLCDLQAFGVRRQSDPPQPTGHSCDLGCVCDVPVVRPPPPAPLTGMSWGQRVSKSRSLGSGSCLRLVKSLVVLSPPRMAFQWLFW